MSRASTVFAIIGVLCVSFECSADIPPEAVAAGKRTTALVVLDKEQGYASAFCIDPSGMFVTNSHVAEFGPTMTLVLAPGEKEQRTVKARVIRQDTKTDLALLKADSPVPLPALPLGDAATLSEAMEVVTFGYPFGAALALKDGQYPNITVATGHITSLRKDSGALKLIQIDASLNPGNSGGPLVNNKGQVVGVVAAGIPGSGINLAIPVSDLRALLVKPAITLSPADLPLARQHEDLDYTIQVVSPGEPTPDTTVELTFTAGPGDTRTYKATGQDGKTFHVKATALQGGGGFPVIQIKAVSRGVENTYRALDQAIVVGSSRVRLKTIRQIDRGRGIQFATGQSSSGTIRGLDSIEVMNGLGRKVIDLSRADTVSVEEVDPFAVPANYTVSVKRAGATIGELTGVLGQPLEVKVTGDSQTPRAPGQDLWAPVVAGDGPAAQWKGGGPDIKLPATSRGGDLIAGFVTKAALRGDFDVQVNYQLIDWPTANGMRLGLRFVDVEGGQVGALQRNNDGGENSAMTIFNRAGGAEDVTKVPTFEATGRFRLIRQGNSFSGFLWDKDTNQWTPIHRGGDFGDDVRLMLIAWSDDGRFCKKDGHLLFTNFSVNRGQWVIP